MSHPQRALDEMALLRDRLSTPAYQAYSTRFLDSVQYKHAGPVWTDEQGRASGYVSCKNEITRLDMAEAYFVGKDMTHLVQWAAASLEGTDRFSREVWPTDFGFVWFEEGPVSMEVWGRKAVTSAMTWGRMKIKGTGPGTLVNLYSDIRDLRDEVNAEFLLADKSHQYDIGNLHLTATMWIDDEQRVGPVSQATARYIAEAYGGKPPASRGEPAPEVTNETRFILAYLMMLGQTVTDVREHVLDRRTAKRFGRMNLPDRVTVVQLRRHAGSRSDGESTVEWAHRWIVRGHWRNQPYKTADGGIEYRKIWISPYQKGPEDKPLMQSTKIYALVR